MPTFHLILAQLWPEPKGERDADALKKGKCSKFGTQFLPRGTGLFRVRGIFHPPGISLLDGPILKSFKVVP